MMETDAAVGEWQKSLEDNFTYNGIVGGRILPSTMEQERICGSYFIKKFHGHRILADSFLDFLAVTLRSMGDGHSKYGWPSYPYYTICLLEFITQFRGLRAAEILSVNGYPLDAYALQRNLKDQAIFLGAIVNGTSSFPALYGLKRPPPSEQWSKEEHRATLRQRKEEEVLIFRQMIGRDSGLGDEHIAELKHWNELFHLQVHGARLSTAGEIFAWIKEKKDFAVGPRMDDDGSAMYMNRFTEIAWMTLRSLPFLQTEAITFDDVWHHQWDVLDIALRESVEGLGSLGKQISPAFVALIESKFDTSCNTKYVEREVGSGGTTAVAQLSD